ncbi:DUF2164 family protein [Priestia aryabhattai]|nr:DUF2164 family protein [Priestia aryabhattai]
MDKLDLKKKMTIIKKFQEFCEEKYNIEFGELASDEIINFFLREFEWNK